MKVSLSKEAPILDLKVRFTGFSHLSKIRETNDMSNEQTYLTLDKR